MFTYSEFKHEWTHSAFFCHIPTSASYRVTVNGQPIPVYTCRISAYPFNTPWPGHQRPIDQTEIVSYVNLISDEPLHVEVEPLKKSVDGKVMIKPYSKGIEAVRTDAGISFTLQENGGYVLEIGDYHDLLYIFNNKPIPAPNRESVTHYFGKGVHFPGKIVLRSNESIYVDKDALVYGYIYAENADHIHVFGNGIFDDSGEERFCEPCYEPYANGNIKLYDCTDVRIEGVGFVNSVIWCVNLFHCFDVRIDGINVFGQWRYNTDGIDIVNSQRVTVKNSFIHSFDDTITVKGINRYEFESNRDMLFEDCVLWCDWGKTCEIGLETSAREYDNITFRSCDVLRGGNTVCDIQNGDWAEVHHITFEDIRIELESFYTPYQVQRSETEVYSRQNEIEIPYFLSVKNKRFHKNNALLYHYNPKIPIEVGQPYYAGVRDILVKDIVIYCDDTIRCTYGTKCAAIFVLNVIPTTRYERIRVENVTLDGKRLSLEEMNLTAEGETATESLTVC